MNIKDWPIFRFIIVALWFIGTFMGVFMVMISALHNLNEVEPIDAAGNAVLILCAIIASFAISASTINKFISEK
jgi:hypothetical protein